MNRNENKQDSLPVILSAHDLQKLGFSRPMAYLLLNRTDFPVLQIGGRKFVLKEKLFEWLDAQSNVVGK